MAPSQIYLRSREGQPLGPLPLATLEVLFTSRVVSEETPISGDGAAFLPLGEWAEVRARLHHVRSTIQSGGDPWATSPGQFDLTSRPPLAALFHAAATGATGVLRFEADQIGARLQYLDGKIVVIETESPELAMASFLIERGLVPQERVEQAVLRAPAVGGDLGAALIAMGAIAPHTYLEQLGSWARQVIGSLAMWDAGTATLEVQPVAAPQVPLGLDRFGVLYEAVKGIGRDRLETELGEHQTRTLIPASLDGVTLEELKLPPRELRVIKAIDGTRSIEQLLSGGDEQARTTGLRAVYFAIAIGLVVVGEDALVPKEQEEAKKLRARYDLLRTKSPLDIIGVRTIDDDNNVRSRYMTLAKEFHPDRLRANAAPELLEVRRQLFALVQGAFEAVETTEKRETLRQLAEAGFDTRKSEHDIVKDALEAETDFRKAEVLVKVKRYDEAMQLIDQAIGKKPGDVEFKVHRAYYRTLAKKSSPEALQAAVTEITALIKGDNKLASGFLFLGRLHKQLGDGERSFKCFKKVLEFDPKNHEANSEIRLHNMRTQKDKKKWL